MRVMHFSNFLIIKIRQLMKNLLFKLIIIMINTKKLILYYLKINLRLILLIISAKIINIGIAKLMLVRINNYYFMN